MENNKKILCLTPSLSSGGSEKVMSILANELSRKNNVELCILRNKEDVYKIDENVSVIRFSYQGKNSLIRVIKRIHFIRERIKNNDVIISFMYDINFMTLIASFGLKKRIIISERNYPEIENKKGLWIPILRKLLYPKANVLVFQTPKAMEWFSNKIKEKSVVIPNPIGNNMPKKHIGERKKVLVAAGRMTEQKNFDMLIDGFAKIAEKYEDYNLVIYGQGPLLNKLKEKSNKYGLEKRILFPGFVDNVDDKINEASIYVSTSNYEGISNSMMEALAMGVPTICTDCPVGGAKMMIENNVNGILIPMNDVDALYNAMIKILDNQDFSNKISKQAIKIKDKYSVEEIVKEWEKLL